MLREPELMGGGPTGLRGNYLNQILLQAAESLDLTPTQRDKAEKSYAAVGDWLDATDSPLRAFRPLIYAQGSFALGTPVKPLGRDDFDLDATCVLNIPPDVTPDELKKLVGDRLRAHATYKTMIEEKTRCWRLNHAHDFHFDIIPAKPKYPATDLTAILITDATDKHRKKWGDSDPKSYVRWFDEKKTLPLPLLENFSLRARAEPLPKPSGSDKTPLQVAIQLMKRHRDVMFQDRENAPISIIITTLAAHAYQQEASVLATIRGILDRMASHIDYTKGFAYVANPTNGGENFADKWRVFPEREEAFYEWNKTAKGHLNQLESAKGIHAVRIALIPFLGERRVDIVLNRMAEDVNKQETTGIKVDTNTGLIGVSTGIVVPKKTFYGDATI